MNPEPPIDPTSARSILATDCGSTTTKAILIRKMEDGHYRLVTRGEAPTTVEAPFDDVTVGVVNALREVEELSGMKLVPDSGGPPITPARSETEGVDLYLSTSSAGGGLQMTVTGVVKEMSAESAQRAALGAGAIIIDVIAVNDGRKEHERVERLRQLRPDMILMSGGTDGGAVAHLVEMAEMLVSADPRPRLGIGMKLPVIYAGNQEAYAPVEELLGSRTALRRVDNLRPSMDRERLEPAREAIHELFLEHVMQQAPGYAKLSDWTSAPIMSTPNAVGEIMRTIAQQRGINVLGVDIGGATTDVFSVFDGNFTRTVSANLGMSYSICNVLTEAGVDNIRRWLPFDIADADLRNQLRNKMIRPTTIPQRLEDLYLEQAVSREALRLAFVHHRSLARALKGVSGEKNVGNIFEGKGGGQSLVQMMRLDMIVGSGGVLSHAAQRQQAAMMLIDAYQPEGITMLTVDSIFMMPQLGVLSRLHPVAATEVFERDCLIYLGACVAPVGAARAGEPCVTVEVDGKSCAVPFGALRVVEGTGDEERAAEEVDIVVKPSSAFDAGGGKGREVAQRVRRGVCGVIIDARGRPMVVPPRTAGQTAMRDWMDAMAIAPVEPRS